MIVDLNYRMLRANLVVDPSVNKYDKEAAKMTADRIREFYATTPFQPFDMHLVDGRTISVDHPELMAIYPSGRTLAVVANDVTEIIDVLHVTSIKHRSNGRSRRRGRT